MEMLTQLWIFFYQPVICISKSKFVEEKSYTWFYYGSRGAPVAEKKDPHSRTQLVRPVSGGPKNFLEPGPTYRPITNSWAATPPSLPIGLERSPGQCPGSPLQCIGVQTAVCSELLYPCRCIGGNCLIPYSLIWNIRNGAFGSSKEWEVICIQWIL